LRFGVKVLIESAKPCSSISSQFIASASDREVARGGLPVAARESQSGTENRPPGFCHYRKQWMAHDEQENLCSAVSSILENVEAPTLWLFACKAVKGKD